MSEAAWSNGDWAWVSEDWTLLGPGGWRGESLRFYVDRKWWGPDGRSFLWHGQLPIVAIRRAPHDAA